MTRTTQTFLQPQTSRMKSRTTFRHRCAARRLSAGVRPSGRRLGGGGEAQGARGGVRGAVAKDGLAVRSLWRADWADCTSRLHAPTARPDCMCDAQMDSIFDECGRRLGEDAMDVGVGDVSVGMVYHSSRYVYVGCVPALLSGWAIGVGRRARAYHGHIAGCQPPSRVRCHGGIPRRDS